MGLYPRRELLTHSGVLGLRIVGKGECRDTSIVREFLYKNFVPFTWYDPDTPEGRHVFEALGSPGGLRPSKLAMGKC